MILFPPVENSTLTRYRTLIMIILNSNLFQLLRGFYNSCVSYLKVDYDTCYLCLFGPAKYDLSLYMYIF